ncbi:hypothetical protein [Corynebacterium tuberculostearicum]|uniref:hypothetical protein n=1 Tax=Corynebacterium tuberculostearicum TaxID=38304 RepID=UPI0026490BAD|nr:hypothetical protein [Corynebacterium tuberculostearicum]MDV2421124.1 hypothetical protein [Corynebacterium tuberculostearicum]WKE60344.1 hypothetical protein KAH61_04270 [Corynebacterium tuberculostearicum]
MTSSITLISHEGAQFASPYGEGMIRFGDSAEQVVAVLGEPENHRSESTLYYSQSNIQVHFGDNGVEFIEIATNPEKDGVTVEWEGHNLSHMNAIECAELLKGLNDGARLDDERAPEAYAFEKLGLSVWQPYALADAREELEEERAGGAEGDELEYFEEEVKMAECFDAIGLGSRDYMNEYF